MQPRANLPRKITVTLRNVQVMAVDDKHGAEKEAEVLGEYRQAGQDIMGGQKSRRDDQS